MDKKEVDSAIWWHLVFWSFLSTTCTFLGLFINNWPIWLTGWTGLVTIVTVLVIGPYPINSEKTIRKEE